MGKYATACLQANSHRRWRIAKETLHQHLTFLLGCDPTQITSRSVLTSNVNVVMYVS